MRYTQPFRHHMHHLSAIITWIILALEKTIYGLKKTIHRLKKTIYGLWSNFCIIVSSFLITWHACNQSVNKNIWMIAFILFIYKAPPQKKSCLVVLHQPLLFESIKFLLYKSIQHLIFRINQIFKYLLKVVLDNFFCSLILV